jgi:DNA-binding NarL/FixJ family response regulator
VCRQGTADRRRNGHLLCRRWTGIAATRLIKTQYPEIAVIGLTRELKDYTSYSMKKAGAFEIMDKKSAVVELYNAIQRAVGGMDGKAVNRPELGPGLGSMTEVR